MRLAAVSGGEGLRERTLAYDRDTTTPTGWPQCEQLLPHVFAIVGTLVPGADSGPRLIALLNRAADYRYCSRGRAC